MVEPSVTCRPEEVLSHADSAWLSPPLLQLPLHPCSAASQLQELQTGPLTLEPVSLSVCLGNNTCTYLLQRVIQHTAWHPARAPRCHMPAMRGALAAMPVAVAPQLSPDTWGV